MRDSAIKLLLLANLIVVGMLLVRENAAASDSATPQAATDAAQMVVDDGMVYVLHGDRLHVFGVKSPLTEAFLGNLVESVSLEVVDSVRLAEIQLPRK